MSSLKTWFARTFEACGLGERIQDSEAHGGFFDPQSRRHIDLMHFMESSGVSKHAAMLDVGCGNGSLVQRLVDAGYAPLDGADWTPGEEIPALTSGALKTYACIDFNTSGLSVFPDASYDCILCADVLERVDNPAALLRELARVMRPQGDIFLTLPNAFNLFERLRWLVSGNSSRYPTEVYDEYGPTHLFPTQVLQSLLNRAHLEQVAIGTSCCVAGGVMILPYRRFGPWWGYTALYRFKRAKTLALGMDQGVVSPVALPFAPIPIGEPGVEQAVVSPAAISVMAAQAITL